MERKRIDRRSRAWAPAPFIVAPFAALKNFALNFKFASRNSARQFLNFARAALRRRLQKQLSLGRRGERAAIRYLTRKGYVIRHTNWTCKAGELDIIAQQAHCLVFVEVKTRAERAEEDFAALDAVNQKKQAKIKQLSRWYRKDYCKDLKYRRLRNVRFDVIAVHAENGRLCISHHPSAF